MKRLRELRESKRLTQKELGLKFNASQNTISQWEQGIRNIDTVTLCNIADFFGVTTDYLLGRTDVTASVICQENQDLKKKLESLPPDKRKAVEILLGIEEITTTKDNVV
jgi:transcriptional regulator with XRE-family HTH domain